MKKLSFLFALFILLWASPGFGYEYQLYKNEENFGIVVFPKAQLPEELDQYIQSLLLTPVESGEAVMRSGSKGENETFMMPLDVQKKHSIEKFMVIQVLAQFRMMIGIFDPEWGLTLPSSIFGFEEMKKNIPKTLDVFRGNNKRKAIHWQEKSKSTPGPKLRSMPISGR
ncbi:hypothetical protein MNBD_NITROSPINAE05-233 [hydrothermal vent metagenome]|uniref:Uncharacterized protein n=1 Tax=hydrothermal vent metagenome TaxID=652676 RepID=A0A3B1CUB0_9ZZZZ